jgi:hypothetical protein
MRRRPHSLRDNSTDSNRTGLSSPILVLAGLKRVVGFAPPGCCIVGDEGAGGEHASTNGQTTILHQLLYCSSRQNSAL